MVAKSVSRLMFVALILSGCGKSIPVLNVGDNQKICLNTSPQFQVAITDTDYQNTTIEVRGIEQFGGALSCQPGYGSATCVVIQNQQMGFSQNCTEQLPCMLAVIARRGDQVDVKTLQVARMCGTGAPAPR